MNKHLAMRLAKIEEKHFPDQPNPTHRIVVDVGESVENVRARYCEAREVSPDDNWIVRMVIAGEAEAISSGAIDDTQNNTAPRSSR